MCVCKPHDMNEQVFVPLMYGRTESEARDPTARLQSLNELTMRLLSGSVEDHSSNPAAAEGTPTAPQVADGSGGIYLVQGPAGCGKSLFAWQIYTRFGTATPRPDGNVDPCAA